jgi:hypothetical protein
MSAGVLAASIPNPFQNSVLSIVVRLAGLDRVVAEVLLPEMDLLMGGRSG